MGRQKKNRSRRQPRKKGWRTAKTSDVNELYESSVQEPESELEFIDRIWQERRGRLASSIREDFCGTGLISREWVARRESNTAVGVDLDQATLDWSLARAQSRLEAGQLERLRLVCSDALTIGGDLVDSVLAMNFSYYVFKERADLLAYFRSVHESLVDDGILMIDAYGGSDSFTEMTEDRDLDGFTYTWDQHRYNPITGEAINHIHYRFPDGTRIRQAFTYDWRLWTIPEVRDALHEAGFQRVAVYWEQEDEDTGEGSGEWVETTDGEAIAGWIAYIVAEKNARDTGGPDGVEGS